MSGKNTNIDHEEIRRLLLDIDENGTRLTRNEIDFVAGLIDGKVVTFTEKQADKLKTLHDRKVVNGQPDDEID